MNHISKKSNEKNSIKISAKISSKINKTIVLGLSLGVLLFSSGCKSITPPAYDVGLKSKTESLTYETGGQKDTIPIKIDNRKYQDLSKESQDFLSYHLYSGEGEQLRFDNARTDLGTIPARGKGTVNLEFRVPMLAGSYIMEVDLVKEGVSWYSDQGNKTLKIPVTVQKDYIPEYQTQIIAEQDEITVDVNNLKESDEGDKRARLNVTIKNLGTVPLYADGELTPALSYRLYEYDEKSKSTGAPVFEGARYQLDKDIEPGGEETFTLLLNRAEYEIAGQFLMVIDLVQEGVCWYADKGAQTAEIKMVIK